MVRWIAMAAVAGGVDPGMARAGSNLVAVSAFHTGMRPPNKPAASGIVKAKLLVQNGADDPFVEPGAADAFKAEMRAARVDDRYLSTPGAAHGEQALMR